MNPPREEVGSTRQFVLARGFARAGGYDALLDADGRQRLFAELAADPDRPEVRPQEAYQAVLASLQPGWTVRLLQTAWPDPAPRDAFRQAAAGWPRPGSEGLDILRQGLLLAADQAACPLGRRTVLEFVLPGGEGLAWWAGLPGLCAGYGLQVTPLTAAQVLALLQWVCSPRLG